MKTGIAIDEESERILTYDNNSFMLMIISRLIIVGIYTIKKAK